MCVLAPGAYRANLSRDLIRHLAGIVISAKRREQLHSASRNYFFIFIFCLFKRLPLTPEGNEITTIWVTALHDEYKQLRAGRQSLFSPRLVFQSVRKWMPTPLPPPVMSHPWKTHRGRLAPKAALYCSASECHRRSLCRR